MPPHTQPPLTTTDPEFYKNFIGREDLYTWPDWDSYYDSPAGWGWRGGDPELTGGSQFTSWTDWECNTTSCEYEWVGESDLCLGYSSENCKNGRGRAYD